MKTLFFYLVIGSIVLSLFLFSSLVHGDPYDQDTAIFYFKLSTAAYCSPASVMGWNCTSCLTTPNFEPYDYFYDSNSTLFGYVGLTEDSPPNIVTIFRGTIETDLLNWITNLNFPFTVPFQEDPNVRVHEGFLEGYHSLRPQLLTILEPLVAAYPDSEVRITGHSLGAALAVLCATDLKLNVFQNSTIGIYTFGEPRVGNKNFAAMYWNLMSESWRVTHWEDIVPHLPPLDLGFWHGPQEVWYNETSTSYKVCDTSGEDPSCSDSLFLAASIADHLTYLNITINC